MFWGLRKSSSFLADAFLAAAARFWVKALFPMLSWRCYYFQSICWLVRLKFQFQLLGKELLNNVFPPLNFSCLLSHDGFWVSQQLQNQHEIEMSSLIFGTFSSVAYGPEEMQIYEATKHHRTVMSSPLPCYLMTSLVFVAQYCCTGLNSLLVLMRYCSILSLLSSFLIFGFSSLSHRCCYFFQQSSFWSLFFISLTL